MGLVEDAVVLVACWVVVPVDVDDDAAAVLDGLTPVILRYP